MEKNAVKEKMLEALCCFLNGIKVTWEEEMSAEDWRNLFSLCLYHRVLPMVFETVYCCPAFRSLPPQEAQAVKGQVIRQVLIQNRKTEEFLILYKKLLEAGLTPVTVKGIICRNMYREKDYRCSGDEDILIPREQFRKCHKLFLTNGMKLMEPDEDLDTRSEVPYYRENGALHIELHKELFTSESEAYGEFNELFAGTFDRMIQEEIQGVKIYTMCHTDHLLYLILHAFKHFLHSGFGIRQVCDIILYAEMYGADIDWEYILEKCHGIHADVFAASLFDIGKKKLSFDAQKAHYPECWASIEMDGTDLLEDLMAGGVFGDSSMSRKHSSNITLQAVTDDKKGKKAGGSLLHSLLPDGKYMKKKYTYLKDYPFLLPVAWMSRIRRYLKETRKTERNDVKASIEIGNHRVDLMKKYKIIR